MVGKRKPRSYVEEHLKELLDEEIREVGVRLARAQPSNDAVFFFRPIYAPSQ